MWVVMTIMVEKYHKKYYWNAAMVLVLSFLIKQVSEKVQQPDVRPWRMQSI